MAWRGPLLRLSVFAVRVTVSATFACTQQVHLSLFFGGGSVFEAPLELLVLEYGIRTHGVVGGLRVS